MKFFKNKLTVGILLLSVIFLIFIAYSAKRENKTLLEGGIGVALNKIQGVVYSANSKVNDFFGFITNFSEVKNENEELRKKNADLEEKALMYDSVKSENDRLRQQLDFQARNSFYDYEGCNIINILNGGVLDGYTIDKGSKDGVIKGRVVITAQGLVGQVTTVDKYSSIVQNISNENIGVGAMVQSTGEKGIVRGYKDSSRTPLAKMYYLPMDSTIKKGDVIVTSGDGNIYPKGIRIGEVISVEEDTARVMKNAVIKPYVDLDRLEEVFIILPKDRNAENYVGGEIK